MFQPHSPGHIHKCKEPLAVMREQGPCTIPEQLRQVLELGPSCNLGPARALRHMLGVCLCQRCSQTQGTAVLPGTAAATGHCQWD